MIHVSANLHEGDVENAKVIAAFFAYPNSACAMSTALGLLRAIVDRSRNTAHPKIILEFPDGSKERIVMEQFES